MSFVKHLRALQASAIAAAAAEQQHVLDAEKYIEESKRALILAANIGGSYTNITVCYIDDFGYISGESAVLRLEKAFAHLTRLGGELEGVTFKVEDDSSEFQRAVCTVHLRW